MYTYFRIKYKYFASVLIAFFAIGLIIQVYLIERNYIKTDDAFKQTYLEIIKTTFLLYTSQEIKSDYSTEPEKKYEKVFSKIDSALQNLNSKQSIIQSVAYHVKDKNKKIVYTRKNNNIGFWVKGYSDEYNLTDDGELTIEFVNQPGFLHKLSVYFSIIWFLLFVIAIYILRKLIKSFNRLQRIRLDMLNNMSHEFKTPLTSVHLISEILLNDENFLDKAKIKKYGRMINQESGKMLSQTKKLLDAAYLETSPYPLKLRKHNIHGLMHHVVENIRFIYGESDIIIQEEFNAEEFIVYLDRVHFFNVMTNLLENAKKYAKGNSVTVTIKSYCSKDKIFIEFIDNGIGISKENIKNIFNKFYRVTDGNKHKKSGYGIGLYYVDNILKQMNAKIKAESVLNEGTSFIVEFNLIKKEDTK